MALAAGWEDAASQDAVSSLTLGKHDGPSPAAAPTIRGWSGCHLDGCVAAVMVSGSLLLFSRCNGDVMESARRLVAMTKTLGQAAKTKTGALPCI